MASAGGGPAGGTAGGRVHVGHRAPERRHDVERTLHVAQHAGAAPGVGDEAVAVAGGVELGAVVVRVTMRCADGFTVDCTLAPWALAGARRSRVRARHPH